MSRFATFFLVVFLSSSTALFSSCTKPSLVSEAVAQENAWAESDRLISEQKFQAALDKTLEILKSARANNNDDLLTQAIIRSTQLQMGLHGYETAVRFLIEEKWPKESADKVLLNLYYAHSLMAYQSMYGWEIGQREQTVSTDKVDLKQWTTEQIGIEISEAFEKAINEAPALSTQADSFVRKYINPNNYPQGVRPTLRDAVVYMAVRHFANQQYWRPDQSNEVYKLNFARMASGTVSKHIPAVDTKAHPVEKLASWLGEHKAFHAAAGRREAALEAHYELLSSLHSATSEADDQKSVRDALVKLQREQKGVPWWSRGQALLADLIIAEERPGRLIDARAAAAQGLEAFPKSPGGEMCRSILFQIERPTYSFNLMSQDAPKQKSLLLRYRNTEKLFFRAYPLDFDARLKEKPSYGLDRFNSEQIQKLLRSGAKPIAQWSVSLPKTTDYAEHYSLIEMPQLKHGLYVIAASYNESFTEQANSITASNFISTGVVLQSRAVSNAMEARVMNGASGQAIENADVQIYRFTWEKAPELVGSVKTDKQGFAKIQQPKSVASEYWQYFLIARHQGQFAPEFSGTYFNQETERSQASASLVFTDRSIYRPDQKVLFKVVGYEGRADLGQLKTAPAGKSLTVRLVDPNNQKVASANLKLNSFGSASGEFKVPAGRPLGNWRIEVQNFSGSAGFKVEEYKRPTFEAEWKDAEQPLRLNKPAKLRGEAKYYFGLPVSSGLVKWRVTREEVRPWWWSYRGFWMPDRLQQPQTIASGETKVGQDGSFSIDFTPQADERKAANNDGLTYNFVLNADITDEGGETRTAKRSFRLGFVSVEASLTWKTGYFREDEPAAITATLTDLNGKAKAGKGTYRIVRLNQPKTAPLPADLPRDFATDYRGWSEFPNSADLDKYATPDDKKRARWETQFEWQKVTGGWGEGETIAQGSFEHDAKGDSTIKTAPLKESGAFRVIYETKDDFGAKFKTSRDFLVVGARSRPNISLPLVAISDVSSAKVGEKVRMFAHSGLTNQPITLEKYRSGQLIERRMIAAGTPVIELPVTAEDRGGFAVVVSGLRDHQMMVQELTVAVPWSDKELKLEFATMRDKLRPGSKETLRVSVKSDAGKALASQVGEVLAYMFDRSLDLFGPHEYPTIASLYPGKSYAQGKQISLGAQFGNLVFSGMSGGPSRPSFQGDFLQVKENYGIGGPGRRGWAMPEEAGEVVEDMAMDVAEAPMAASSENAASRASLQGRGASAKMALGDSKKASTDKEGRTATPEVEESQIRSNFSETAFFSPHLLTDAKGQVSVEFEVPDSVTSWRVFAHAITQDMRGGSVSAETRSVKELMVRPYAPRFLREGDNAEIKVQVNNASDREISGEVSFDIEDVDTGKSVLTDFGLKAPQVRAFKTAKDGSTTVGFALKAPKRVGTYAFVVKAKSKNFSDGERRPFPVLPSRMHLAQSRFVTLRNQDKKVLEFKDLFNSASDPSLINEQMVVTVDAQLFYGVLQALPYLVTYPYECTEQTLNRFLATGVVTSVFKKYPAVEQMAREFSSRKTRFEKFDEQDPNRRMTLEESPYLELAQGGRETANPLVNVLSSEVAKAEREKALAALRKMQLPSGAFPWFEGGPPDKFMTLYLLMGFSRALEFKVDVPKDMTVKAWSYVRSWLDQELNDMTAKNCCWEIITMVNFALSSYPDDSWTGGAFDAAYRKRLLDYSFTHWKRHAPLVKGYLALTLKRMGRAPDAKLVWDSVMDSAKHDGQLGTYWAPEDRSWLWYNDTIETHAFSLRVQMELDQHDKHNDGLVQWLFLNKKLNHWKSTRATAESIYSLVHYIDKTGGLGQREVVSVDVGNQKTQFVFEPNRYTGKKNQIVIPGAKVDAKTTSKITVEKSTPGFTFASATWHFSTDKLPVDAQGDFFSVNRRYFKREQGPNGQWQLKPLAEGAKLKVGDQVEVQISLRTKHAAEYVHLRDPRAAGLEPEVLNSGYKWDLGIAWYEETRDSGSNFFFDRLPVGEYSFKYRLRANMAGSFRIGPATVQSMYAPEFNAYSQGHTMQISAP